MQAAATAGMAERIFIVAGRGVPAKARLLGLKRISIYDIDMSVNADALQIMLYPHPILRRACEPIERLSEEIRTVAARMVELMHDHRGVGLAAPQVELPWRMFVANPTGEPGDDCVFINPRFLELSEQTEAADEGCLSIPHVNGQIRRPRAATIEATDLDGKLFTLTNDQLPARVWQHETDHLDGVLILDRMNEIDKLANRRMIRDLEARRVPAR